MDVAVVSEPAARLDGLGRKRLGRDGACALAVDGNVLAGGNLGRLVKSPVLRASQARLTLKTHLGALRRSLADHFD